MPKYFLNVPGESHMEMYELLQFSSGFCLTQFVCRLRSANVLENGGGMCDAACCVVSFRLQKYIPKNLNFLLAMQTGPGLPISIPVDVPRQNFHHFCFFSNFYGAKAISAVVIGKFLYFFHAGARVWVPRTSCRQAQNLFNGN